MTYNITKTYTLGKRANQIKCGFDVVTFPLANTYMNSANDIYVDYNKHEVFDFSELGDVRKIEVASTIRIDYYNEQYYDYYYLDDDYTVTLGITRGKLILALMNKGVFNPKQYSCIKNVSCTTPSYSTITTTRYANIKFEINDGIITCTVTISDIDYVLELDVQEYNLTKFTKLDFNHNYYSTSSSYNVARTPKFINIDVENASHSTKLVNADNEDVYHIFNNQTYTFSLETNEDIETSEVKINDEVIDASISDNTLTLNLENVSIGTHTLDISVNDKTYQYTISSYNANALSDGKIIAFQNNKSPNIFYNTNTNKVFSSYDKDHLYFETNNDKLYTAQGSKAFETIYESNNVKLNTFKDNIKIKYDFYCPRVTSFPTNEANSGMTSWYAPIGTLRISEDYYLTFKIRSDYSSSYSRYYNYIYMNYVGAYKDGSYSEGSYNSPTYEISNEAHITLEIFTITSRVAITITDGSKTYTYTWSTSSHLIDKDYLEWSYVKHFEYYNKHSYVRNFEYYMRNFIAYDSSYTITDEDREQMQAIMDVQNNTYVERYGETVVADPIIEFEDVALEGECGKSVELVCKNVEESQLPISYSWSSKYMTYFNATKNRSYAYTYYGDDTYTVTMVGKLGKTVTKSIDVKGIAKLNEDEVYRICPNNVGICYYRENGEVKHNLIERNGKSQYTSYIYNSGGSFKLFTNEGHSEYNSNLYTLELYNPYTIYGTTIYIYFTNGWYFVLSPNYYSSYETTRVSLYDNNGKYIFECGYVYYNSKPQYIHIKGNIIETWNGDRRTSTKTVNTSVYPSFCENLKIESISTSVGTGNGNHGHASLERFIIHKLPIEKPNVTVSTSNENAECFENVNLLLSTDQPSIIEYNGETIQDYLTEQLVETKTYNFTVKNKLDETLVTDVEFTQNIKSLVTETSISNELSLTKVYESQDATITYDLPSTLPQDATLKFYIDGKEVE